MAIQKVFSSLELDKVIVSGSKLLSGEQKRLVVALFACRHTNREVWDHLLTAYPGEFDEIPMPSAYLSSLNPGTSAGYRSLPVDLMDLYNEVRDANELRVANLAISSRTARQERRERDWLALREVVEERARENYEHTNPLMRTGLAVERVVPIGGGETRIEYVLDTSVLDTVHKLEEAAMTEMGHKTGITVQVQTKTIVGINMEDI